MSSFVLLTSSTILPEISAWWFEFAGMVVNVPVIVVAVSPVNVDVTLTLPELSTVPVIVPETPGYRELVAVPLIAPAVDIVTVQVPVRSPLAASDQLPPNEPV